MEQEQQAIQVLKSGGLKCDAPGCDYKDETPIEEYEACINKPCPKCGANLLTHDDYEAFKIIIEGINLINKIYKPEPDEETVNATMNYHDGKLDIKIKPN